LITNQRSSKMIVCVCVCVCVSKMILHNTACIIIISVGEVFVKSRIYYLKWFFLRDNRSSSMISNYCPVLFSELCPLFYEYYQFCMKWVVINLVQSCYLFTVSFIRFVFSWHALQHLLSRGDSWLFDFSCFPFNRCVLLRM